MYKSLGTHARAFLKTQTPSLSCLLHPPVEAVCPPMAPAYRVLSARWASVPPALHKTPGWLLLMEEAEGKGAPGISNTQEMGQGPLTRDDSRAKPACSRVCFISTRGEAPSPSTSAPCHPCSRFSLYTPPIFHHPPAPGCLVGVLFSPSQTGSSSGAAGDIRGG